MSTDRPSLGGLMRALDDLAAAAAAGEVETYRLQLDTTRSQQATEEQILDAYRWGRRDKGVADFDHHGHQ